MEDRLQLESAHSAIWSAVLARTLQIIRDRWRWLALCMAIGTVVGIAASFSGQPDYESFASIQVPAGSTPETTLTSDAVLDGAIKSLPAKFRSDFQGHKRPTWIGILRANLTVSRVNNSVTVRYVSHHPESAARVLDAVVQSFMIHQRAVQLGSFGPIVESFRKESDELNRQMADLDEGVASTERWLSLQATENSPSAEHRQHVLQLQSASTERQRLQTYLELFQRQIQAIEATWETDSKISVTGKPRVPRTSASSRRAAPVLLWILVGTAVGLVLVVVLDRLDDRFDLIANLPRQLGVPLLGVIHRMTPQAGDGMDAVAAHRNRDGVDAEAYRSLMMSLSHSNHQTSQLVFSSVKSGDGTSTTLVNLAVVQAQAGKKILLIDAALQTPGLSRLFDLEGPLGLAQVLQEVQPVADSFLENVFNLGVDGLDFMPAGSCPQDAASLLANPRFAEMLAWAGPIYDQILIDAPPLATAELQMIRRVVPGTVLVIHPDANRRKKVTQLIDRHRADGGQIVGLVASRCPKQAVPLKHGSSSSKLALHVAEPHTQRRRAA